MNNTTTNIISGCPKHETGGGPCYCPGSIYYETVKQNEEKNILAVIAKEHPEAGELYITETKTRLGLTRQVRGKGAVQHGTTKQGVFLCTVGSIIWACYGVKAKEVCNTWVLAEKELRK